LRSKSLFSPLFPHFVHPGHGRGALTLVARFAPSRTDCALQRLIRAGFSIKDARHEICEGRLMRRTLRLVRFLLSPLAALASTSACTPPPPIVAQAPAEAPKAQKVSEWGPQSPQPKWWDASPPCPDGSTIRGKLPPEGNVLECVDANGTPHGPSSVWFPNGHEGTYTEYKNGLRHGRWMHWLHNQPLVECTYSEGRKDGDCTFWFDEGSGFDAESRGDHAYNRKNYVVERYVRGLLVKTTHFKDGKPVD
jgi:hypothetical protein